MKFPGVIALAACVFVAGCDTLHGVETEVSPLSAGCVEQGLSDAGFQFVDLPERASRQETHRWVATKGQDKGWFMADVSVPTRVRFHMLRMHDSFSCATLSKIVLEMRAAAKAVGSTCGAAVVEHFIAQDRCGL